MTDSFEFEDDGRRFVCNTERLSRSNPETWWWFRVSVEANARYAPFRASQDDTQSSVQTNVVGYYNALLARRAEPPVRRWQRGVQRTPQAGSAVIPGADAGTAAPGSLGGAISPP